MSPLASRSLRLAPVLMAELGRGGGDWAEILGYAISAEEHDSRGVGRRAE